jgi:hypothetical protein
MQIGLLFSDPSNMLGHAFRFSHSLEGHTAEREVRARINF